MKIAIVGSRRRYCKFEIWKLFKYLLLKYEDDLTIVSGGAEGVDTWAEQYADDLGIETDIYLPHLDNILNKIDMIRRYYARNKLIVENSAVIYAFVHEDRKGGTENTIWWANKLGKQVVIM